MSSPGAGPEGRTRACPPQAPEGLGEVLPKGPWGLPKKHLALVRPGLLFSWRWSFPDCAVFILHNIPPTILHKIPPPTILHKIPPTILHEIPPTVSDQPNQPIN